MSSVQSIICKNINCLRRNCNDEKDLDTICSKGSFVSRLFRWIIPGRENAHIAKITKQFIKAMDTLEHIPVHVNIPDTEQLIRFDPWIETASKMTERLLKSKSRKMQQLAYVVESRRLGIQYRLGQLKKLDAADAACFDQLKTEAAKWKKANLHFTEYELVEKDIQQLTEMAKHKEFASVLLKNKELLYNYFKWALRDENDTETYVQFRGIPDWLGTYVTKRTSGHFKTRIKNGEKQLTLPFEGKRHNILNPNHKIKMKGGVVASVGKIVDSIKNKDKEVGNFEFYPESGFVNFNIHEFGSYNAETKDYDRIDVNKSGWWKKLPVAEKLSLDQAKEFLGPDADGKKWSIGVRASRTNLKTRDIDGTHGWLMIAVPTDDGNFYQLYNFGRFSKVFPKNAIDLVKFFANSVPGTIALDENTIYKMRQHTRHTIMIKQEDGEYAMSLVANAIRQARNNILIFQLLSNGCVRWVQDTFNKVAEKAGKEQKNFFCSDVLKSAPRVFPLNFLRSSVSLLPSRFHVMFTWLVLRLLGSHRQYRGYSLSRSGIWSKKKIGVWERKNKSPIWNPTVMFKRQIDQIKGKFKGPSILPEGKLPAFLKTAQGA